MSQPSSPRKSDGHMLSAQDFALQEDKSSKFGRETTHLRTQNRSLQIVLHDHEHYLQRNQSLVPQALRAP